MTARYIEDLTHCLRSELRGRNDPVIGPLCRDMAKIDIAELRAARQNAKARGQS